MIQVVQAFDRAPIAELPEDDAAALERKLAAAAALRAAQPKGLPIHERIDILRRLGTLMEDKRTHLGRQIAREGGKPLTDALIEADRAIDGVRNAIDVLRQQGGQEIPMGITTATAGRRAFTF